MKSRPRSPLCRIGFATLAALATLVPAVASAESTVFKTTFATDTLHSATPSITPTGTNWYIMSSKNGTASSLSNQGGGLNLTYVSPSNAAGVEGVARFTTSPISLAAVGDSITARATVYTQRVRYLAIGLYDSKGVNPLSTLQNGGLSGAAYAGADGTLGWEGYRARVETGLVAGSIATRPAQVAPLTQQAHDVVAPSSGDYNAPGPTSIGYVPASATSVTFTDDLATEYRVRYTITRTAADTLSISYTISDAADTVLYSVSGLTTNTGTRPSTISSVFDSFAIGTRNTTLSGDSVSTLNISAVSITASNADIARVVSQPYNQSWVTGQPGSLKVAAAGSGTLTYQWYKGADAIPGATSATYPVASASASDIGEYRVVVTNAVGSETSATVNVDVVASASAPSFVTPPAAQAINAGEKLTLVASASGSPTPTYQWSKFNGSTYVAISGATFPTYSIPATATTDAGTYRVTATNGSGAPTSDAVITVNTAAPAIVTPPANVTVNVGQSIALTTAASGYPAPTYQWYKGSTAIPGATDSVYTVASATTTGDNGTYHVVASQGANSATSSDATVTVNVIAPAITTEPANATVTLGQQASFTVAASGSAPLSYQWYKGSTPIDGATSATYTINPTVGSSAGNYHVVVNNESGVPATSATVVLNLVVTETTPVLTTSFANDTIHATTPIITPTSTNWYIMATKDARISNVGDDPATTDVVEARPLNLGLNSLTSAGNYQAAAIFTQTPVSLSSVGSSITVTATFIPSNILNFGFGLFNSAGSLPHTIHNDGVSGNAISGISTSTPGINGITGGTQNWTGYHGFLNNAATSGSIVRRLAQNNPTPTDNRSQDLVTNGSANSTYQFPGNLSIGSLTNSGSAITWTTGAEYTLVYQISRSNTDQYTIGYKLYTGPATTISPATQIFSSSGATTAAGALPSAVTSSFDSFAFGGRSTDNAAGRPLPQISVSKLSVTYAYPVTAIFPAITDQPEGAAVAVGAPFTLTAAASGSPTPTYQWWKNTGSGFAAIPGATSVSYTVVAASATDAATYKFVATNALGSVESDVATVTVGSAASAYDTWASAKGLTGANNGPTQDPDADGVNNLLEFTLGGEPLVSSTAILPVVGKSGANLTLAYNVEVAATEDYNVVPTSSTDLTSTWTPVVHGVGGATIVETPVDADTDHVVVTVPATGARTFLRVEVAPKP